MMIDLTGHDDGAYAAPDTMRSPIIAEDGELRAKNQITIPRAVAQAMGLQPGDRLVFVVEKEGTGHAHVYRMPQSFAGIAPTAYGGPGGTARYLKAEREGWED